jgi:hypothetical protein
LLAVELAVEVLVDLAALELLRGLMEYLLPHPVKMAEITQSTVAVVVVAAVVLLEAKEATGEAAVLKIPVCGMTSLAKAVILVKESAATTRVTKFRIQQGWLLQDRRFLFTQAKLPLVALDQQSMVLTVKMDMLCFYSALLAFI